MAIMPDVVSIPITSRAEWLEWRRQDVTASDIAAVCGVHPERSALQVFLEKTRAPAGADNDNKLMRRGRWLEPAVLEAVRDQYPEWTVSPYGIYLRSPSLRIGATPDGTILDGGGNRAILQAKVVSRSVFEGWGGEVPLYYVLQVITEMAMTGLRDGYLAALVVSEFTAELHMFPIEWNDDAWARVKRDVGAWWADVTAGRKPRADYSKDNDALKQLHEPDGRDAKARVDLSGDNRLQDLCAEYAACTAAIKALSADKDACVAEIVDKLAGVGKAKCGGFNLSYSSISIPEKVVAAYAFNRLTITSPKGK